MPSNLVCRGFMCPLTTECKRFKKKPNLRDDSVLDHWYDHESGTCDGLLRKAAPHEVPR